MASVRLRGLTKVYPGGVTAVEAFDLDVRDGEFVVLVGPSGCGKSTTLRMVAGLEEISDGELWIGDRRVDQVAARDRDVAMVFQSYALYPHLSVRRNLAFGLERRRKLRSRLRRWVSRAYREDAREEDAAIEAHVLRAARSLGIEGLLDRKPAELSGGQRQRVAVGRALVREPAVFLFDEPLSNLDAKLRIEMRAELKDLHRRTGATMLYVTHDQEEAMTLGDRLVVMRDGVVQQVGSPREVYDRPANRFVGGFVGTPSMNFLAGDVVDGGFVPASRTERVPLTGDAIDGPVVLGVRPDRVRVGEGPLVANVRLVEDLGDRRDVLLELPGPIHWTARLDATGPVPALGETRLGFGPDAVHLFAPDGEQARRG